MNNKPSTHGANGQDAQGRFAKGNTLGRGNPLAGRAAQIRAVLLKCFTPERAEVVAEALIAQAEAGDLAAIRELLDRTTGNSIQTIDITAMAPPNMVQIVPPDLPGLPPLPEVKQLG